MNKRYRIVEGPESCQGTPEWLEFRRGKISASIAPAIMGESPFQTRLELFESIIQDKPLQKTEAMERGNRLEPEARDIVNDIMKVDFQPVVVQSLVHPDFIASLDGYAIGGDGKPVLLEIKCAGPVDHALALGGQVPPKYKAQVNHQMDLVGVNEMIYASYDGKEVAIVNVKRDEHYCSTLFAEELSFLASLLDMRAPPPTERDWVEFPESDLADELVWYHDCCDKMDEYKGMKDEAKEKILQKISHPRTKIGRSRIQLVTKKGEIDYAKAIEDLGLDIDLEKYRKPTSQYWKIGY